MRPKKPSPAMLVACAALFVALGGSAVAASQYVISSPNQIKPSVLSALVPVSGSEIEVPGAEVALRPGQAIGVARADCPKAGALVNSPLSSSKPYHLVSGGYVAALGAGAQIISNKPSGSDGWSVLTTNHNSSETSHVRAFALCAPGRVAFAGAGSWSVSGSG
jgi:hypothetical protein